MSAGCLRLLFGRTVRSTCAAGPVTSWRSGVSLLTCRDQYINRPQSWNSLLSTTAEDEPGLERIIASRKKKQDPRARATIGSVGRKINARVIQVISETGENLGTMHRADVIRLMDEKGLKLVVIREHADPPVYRLMTGKQIHEEQMKLHEKQKDKAGPVQLKELGFSSDIAAHDLKTKLRQVQVWLEKKHHVKITVKTKRGASVPSLDTALEQMTQQMEVPWGYVSKPKVIKDGQAAMCVLRPPSKKELQQLEQNKMAASPAADSTPPADSSPPAC